MDPNRTDDVLVHDIFTMTADGRHERNLTNTPGQTSSSPRGRRTAG